MKKLYILLISLVFAGSSFAQVTDVNVFVTLDKSDVSKNIFYPSVGMGAALSTTSGDAFNWTPGANDWTYKSAQAVFYIVPAGTQSFTGADFILKYDAAKASIASFESGDLFPDVMMQKSDVTGGVRVNISNLTGNITPADGKYLAKVTFNILVPGSNEISVESSDFRYYDASDIQRKLTVVPHKGYVKLFVGDFSSGTNVIDQSTGDAMINMSDLNPFSVAYWKVQPAAGYKSKFDIGPNASSGAYYAFPTPDGKIEFEDLMLFSIGYNKSANNQLNKQNGSLTISAGQAENAAGEVRIPVMLKGSFSDLRGLSLEASSSSDLLRVEAAGELAGQNTFVISKQENGKIFVDAAVIGSENKALSQEGTILYLVLKSGSDISFTSIKARDSYNNPINIAAKGTMDSRAAVPSEFALGQNYPNPFNPSTVISYQLPKQSMVEVSVFNSLGQKVSTLVNNEIKEAGYYNLTWNASNMTSGIYYYMIKAGEFSVTKKMMLIK